MHAELLLTGHQEHQSEGGGSHRSAAADGQLANGLVEQQQQRAVRQPGGEVAAGAEKTLAGATGGQT